MSCCRPSGLHLQEDVGKFPLIWLVHLNTIMLTSASQWPPNPQEASRINRRVGYMQAVGVTCWRNALYMLTFCFHAKHHGMSVIGRAVVLLFV